MHTKGEWKVAEVDGNRLTCIYTDETNIALLVHQEDARLIASAPELLEACKEAEEFLGYYRIEGISASHKSALDKIRQTIKKAEGK